MTCAAPDTATATCRRTEPMELLETKGITKSYDSREIIRDISIRLTEGEIVSLL